MLTPQTQARRAGFTLVELLIVMVVMGLVAGAIVMLLLRQQRFYGSTSTVIETRQQIRQAAGLLPSDLRGISSVGGDIYAMTADSIAFRSTFGSSVACVLTLSGGKSAAFVVNTVPLQLARGSLTGWSAAPAVNDSVALYDNGATSKVADDVWKGYGITAVTKLNGNSNGACPTTTGLAQAGDLVASNSIYQLTLSPTPGSVTSPVGAGMRFFRSVVYKRYQAADGQWYLGYYTCKNGQTPSCSAIQPIAGPFLSNGVELAYFDSTGAATTTPANVARIRLSVRGQGAGLVNLSGAKAGKVFTDSLTIQVGLRNRK